jgi:hypothetical protein
MLKVARHEPASGMEAVARKSRPDRRSQCRASPFPETREKIAAANIGKHSDKKISAEHRAAVSAANRGREFSSQHRERISAALIAFYERVSPPMSPAERLRREARRQYNRQRRENARRVTVCRKKKT